MQQEESKVTVPHDTEESEEPVLVEAQEFSEDDETFAQGVDEENHSDFDYDEEEEDQKDEDEFEEEEDEMSLTRIGLHDLNTLSHLYRFGLLNAASCKISCS
jgi:hypothetical protein